MEAMLEKMKSMRKNLACLRKENKELSGEVKVLRQRDELWTQEFIKSEEREKIIKEKIYALEKKNRYYESYRDAFDKTVKRIAKARQKRIEKYKNKIDT